MVTQQVVGLELPLLRLVTQLVGMARDIRADDYGAAVGEAVDGHLREGVTTQRGLTVRDLLLGVLELSGQRVRPSGEHLHDLLVELVAALVPLRGRCEGTRRRTGGEAGGIEVFGALVAVAHAMVVVDVPVEVDENLLAFLRHRNRNSQRVVVVGSLGRRNHRVIFRLRRRKQLRRKRRTGRAHRHRSGTLELFVVGEEEQLVLNDGAAEGATVALLFEVKTDGLVRRQPGAVLGLGTGHRVVVVVVVSRTVEFVGARLRDDVDGAALEARILGVVGRGEDREALHCIERNGRAVGGVARTVQTEVVVLLHAVDGEAIEAVVLASDGDGVAVLRVEVDGRVVTDYVLQVAVDAGRVLDFTGREGCRDAELRFAFTRGRNFHFADHFQRLQRNAEREGTTEAGEDVVDRAGFVAVCLHFHAERTTDTHATGAEAASIVRGGRGLRARRHVRDGDLGVSERLAIGTGDSAENLRGSFLRVGHARREAENRDATQQERRGKDTGNGGRKAR